MRYSRRCIPNTLFLADVSISYSLHYGSFAVPKYRTANGEMFLRKSMMVGNEKELLCSKMWLRSLDLQEGQKKITRKLLKAVDVRLTSILALSGYNSEALPLEPAFSVSRHAFARRENYPLASVYLSVRPQISYRLPLAGFASNFMFETST